MYIEEIENAGKWAGQREGRQVFATLACGTRFRFESIDVRRSEHGRTVVVDFSLSGAFEGAGLLSVLADDVMALERYEPWSSSTAYSP